MIYPRYWIRQSPWIAEGTIMSIEPEGVTITRSINPQGFHKPFKAAYYIPTLYFEEGRVFKTSLQPPREEED